jgi:hypothetical protein
MFDVTEVTVMSSENLLYSLHSQICRFDFFTPTLIIYLIKKLNIYLNFIM